VLELEHTSTLITVNNLGRLYYDQGKLVEAEAVFQRLPLCANSSSPCHL
jgi:hypothetical protein